MATYKTVEARNIADLVAGVETALAGANAAKILAFQFQVSDQVVRTGVEFKVAFTYDLTGATLTDAFRVQAFVGATWAAAVSSLESWIAANPTYWVSTPYFGSLPAQTRALPAVVLVAYNTDSTAAQNWTPGQTSGGDVVVNVLEVETQIVLDNGGATAPVLSPAVDDSRPLLVRGNSDYLAIFHETVSEDVSRFVLEIGDNGPPSVNLRDTFVFRWWELGTETTTDWLTITYDISTTYAAFGAVVSAEDYRSPSGSTPHAIATTTGTVTLLRSNGATQTITPTGAITLSGPADMRDGEGLVIVITQGATPQTVDIDATWKVAGGSALSFTNSANAVDVLQLLKVGSTIYASLAVADAAVVP